MDCFPGSERMPQPESSSQRRPTRLIPLYPRMVPDCRAGRGARGRRGRCSGQSGQGGRNAGGKRGRWGGQGGRGVLRRNRCGFTSRSYILLCRKKRSTRVPSFTLQNCGLKCCSSFAWFRVAEYRQPQVFSGNFIYLGRIIMEPSKSSILNFAFPGSTDTRAPRC